jgi:hypothetical protein
MNNFSFSNKAYDLLLSLKEENIIRDTKQLEYKSVSGIRLMIDIVKSKYPLYANADAKTILDFVEDTFNTRIIKSQFEIANQEEEYIPITCGDIKPGKTYRLTALYSDGRSKPKECYYHYTFPDREMSLKEYNDHFMKIYRNRKPMILKQHIFKYKIGDRVINKYDTSMIGSIIDRCAGGVWFPQTDPFRIYPNFYNIRWDTNTSFKHFYNENEINDVMKNKKTIETFNQKTHDGLVDFYKYTPKEIEEKKIGYVKKEIEVEKPKRRKGKKYSKTKAQRIDEIKKRKLRRTRKLLEYTPRPIQETSKKIHAYKYVKKITDGSV